ncbi:hypothetical protein [Peribacillus sp. NJ11]
MFEGGVANLIGDKSKSTEEV